MKFSSEPFTIIDVLNDSLDEVINKIIANSNQKINS